MSEHIVEHAANHARQIQQAIETVRRAARGGRARRRARARTAHRRRSGAAPRSVIPSIAATPKPLVDDDFRKRFAALDPAAASAAHEVRKRAPVPPHPERDLLWFIANYAPELESWERDIFLAVREESFYFYPVFATQIMNEGWASYWHARLLREADFMPQQAYVDAIKCHSDVVRPIAADQQVALSINPYHLGFSMWEKIVERDGLDAARQHHGAGRRLRLRAQPPDARARDELEHVPLQRARRRAGQGARASTSPRCTRRCSRQKYNFGAPSVAAKHVRMDGTLELTHDHAVDGRGLDLERSRKVLDYVHRVWRRPSC